MGGIDGKKVSFFGYFHSIIFICLVTLLTKSLFLKEIEKNNTSSYKTFYPTITARSNRLLLHINSFIVGNEMKKKNGAIFILCFYLFVLDTIQWMRVRSRNAFISNMFKHATDVTKDWTALHKLKQPSIFNLFTWTWWIWCESIETFT